MSRMHWLRQTSRSERNQYILAGSAAHREVATSPCPTLNRMITAFVLIDADAQRIPETAQAVADVPGVAEVYSCAGDVDLIAVLRVRDHEQIAEVVTGAINKVAGVTNTATHIAFKSYSRADVDAAFAIGE